MKVPSEAVLKWDQGQGAGRGFLHAELHNDGAKMSEWDDTDDVLPTKADFDPFAGCLDALNAWKDIGGLSRKAAYEKFCQNPGYYQEDFMFMDRAAFAYYFPVIERYVLESRVQQDTQGDVEAISILAYCIKAQIEGPWTRPTQELRRRIIGLVRHVRGNLAHYSVEPDEQARIDIAWQDLESALDSISPKK
jgi:hypothetical protein